MSAVTEGTLIAWEPRHQPPVIESACPSCGRTGQRKASSWRMNVHSGLHATLVCEPGFSSDKDCYRVWEVNMPVTEGEGGGSVSTTAQDTARIDAIARLGFARIRNPELASAVAEARLDLAAAIMAMDEAEDIPGRHNLNEQAAVETALRAFGQAFANLIRGEEQA